MIRCTSLRFLAPAVVAALLTAAVVLPAAGADAPVKVVSLDGREAALDDLTAGGPTLLFFWATWCRYCAAEMPRLDEAHRRLGGTGLKILAVNPGVRDSLERARSYVAERRLAHPVWFDPTRASVGRFSLIGTPTVILLGADGRELYRSDTVDVDALERLLTGQS